MKTQTVTKIFLLLAVIGLTGCERFRKDFLGKDEDKPKQQQAFISAETYAGVATGPITITETLANEPVAVDVYWSERVLGIHNGRYELACSKLEDAVLTSYTTDPVLASPYAVVTITGLDIIVQFKGMPNVEGCWSFRARPAGWREN